MGQCIQVTDSLNLMKYELSLAMKREIKVSRQKNIILSCPHSANPFAEDPPPICNDIDKSDARSTAESRLRGPVRGSINLNAGNNIIQPDNYMVPHLVA